MDRVFALPDLSPMSSYDGTENQHRSFDELRRLLLERFAARARRINLRTATFPHFRVHCLKHDLEVLLLAVPELLRQRLRTPDTLRDHWRMPIEDENDRTPPKRIIERLFDRYRKKPGYVATIDAPWILQRAELDRVTAACPQRFQPFVEELRTLADGGTLT